MSGEVGTSASRGQDRVHWLQQLLQRLTDGRGGEGRGGKMAYITTITAVWFAIYHSHIPRDELAIQSQQQQEGEWGVAQPRPLVGGVQEGREGVGEEGGDWYERCLTHSTHPLHHLRGSHLLTHTG